MAAKKNKRGSRKRKKSGGGKALPIVGGLFLLLLLLSVGIRYRGELGELVASFGRGEGSSGGLASAPRRAAVESVAESLEPEPDASAIQLQILNAAGVDRLALDTGDRLRLWGVDTLDRGNAPAWPFPETLLLVRSDEESRREAVEDLAARLGGVPVIMQRRRDLVLDATLLLGHDWDDYRWPEP